MSQQEQPTWGYSETDDVSPLSDHSQQLCSQSSRAAEPHRRVTSLVMGSSCSTGTLLPAIVASPGEGPAWGAAVSRWSTAIDRGSQVCEMPTLTVDPDTTSRGPSNWSKIYPKAAGEKQSPIDIVQKNVQSDPFLAENPLRWNYKGLHCTNLLNTGCGWRADVTAQGPKKDKHSRVPQRNISGGPLHHNYQMVQFHSHWGTCSKMGSEHTVDGEHYAGELHLVHYNLDMYSRASEAACSDKGLSVIGIFLKEGQPHEELQKITDSMKKVIYRGDKCSIDQDIDIGSLIPKNSSYWTYEGSLTTPPCYESVTWIVFKEPIEVSQEQFEAFRELMSYKEGEGPKAPTDGPILKNYRPPQPLMGRVVRDPAN